jgi:hypothetical protein
MYRILRNSHLFLGLFSCFFLLMYGTSSVQMSHNRWFNTRPNMAQSEMAVQGANPREVARELMARGMRGELTQVAAAKDGAGFNFRIVRPGTIYEVAWADGNAKIRTSEANFIGMLNRIHHIGGLWHEFTLLNIWAFFVGVVSLALVLLGATGIYLWFKIHQERVIGTILLVVGLGWGLTLLVLVRTA